MLDLKELREKSTDIEKKLQTKDGSVKLEGLLSLDAAYRSKLADLEHLKSERNKLSIKLGELKRQGQPVDSILAKVNTHVTDIQALESICQEMELDIQNQIASLPNISAGDIKVSPDPKDNVCIKEVGQKPIFAFPFKHHVELNEKLHLFDFERGAKISGSGWVV